MVLYNVYSLFHIKACQITRGVSLYREQIIGVGHYQMLILESFAITIKFYHKHQTEIQILDVHVNLFGN